MGQGKKLSVVSGSVQALGSATAPVRVLSDKTRQGLMAAPGDWDQWVFSAGTTSTRLEHVVFEHGRGLAINGSAPVLNSVEIRNSLGAAISVDLAASPVGVGNKASGNTLNGIALPAGDLAGSVRWGLRRTPKIIEAGVLSVGVAPKIASVSPGTVEQGQTTTLTVNGVRLDGLFERFVGPARTCTDTLLGRDRARKCSCRYRSRARRLWARRACACSSMPARSSSPTPSP